MCTTGPPSSSTSRLTDCGLPAPRFQISPVLPVSRRQQERLGDVGHVEEVARLRAVADHRERLAGELLLEEHAEHRAVGARGARARAVGVEDADRVDRQLVDLVPVERRLLALVLAQRIGILRRDRMVLARRRRGEAVAGRRGRVDELLDAGVRARTPACARCPARWPTCTRAAARSTARCRRCRRSGTRSRRPRTARCAGLEVADVGRLEGRSRGLSLVVREIGARARRPDCRSRGPCSRGRAADRPCGCR